MLNSCPSLRIMRPTQVCLEPLCTPKILIGLKEDLSLSYKDAVLDFLPGALGPLASSSAIDMNRSEKWR